MGYNCCVNGCKREWHPGCGITFHRIMNSYGNNLDNDEDEHGYDNLCKYSIEKCELCDMVFSSRFANIIHTSQHIIIPLIKQKIHQCKKCLHCFTLKSDLKAHKQAKHKKKDINEDDDRQIGQEGSQIGQEKSQIDDEGSQICHKESQIIIDHKKSGTGKKKTHKRSQSDHKESEKAQKESESEKDALLRSIIMKQPIVKVDNIANMVAKTLLATKDEEKHTKVNKDMKILEKEGQKSQKDKRNKETDNAKTQKNTKLLEKDGLKIRKDKSNKEKDDSKKQKETRIDEKETFKTKKLNKIKETPEIIFSSNKTSQMNITDIPTKILIGGKKPMKRKSPDKTDNSLSKRDKKSSSTDTNKSERDKQPDATVTNGVRTTDLTEFSTNRYRFDYRAISPDVISIKSDSSSPERILPITEQSKRSLITFTYEDNLTKTVPQKDQSKTISQKDQSKTISQKNQSIKIPLVKTESDNELEAKIDELLLLNNVTSPIKKSNFRSKLQFEDDENIKLLDLDRELSNLSYEFKSVHYDELVEPELSECRRCHMIFINKLTLYKHETSHMRFKRSKRHYFCKFCENYYPGNHLTQKKHYDTVHNAEVDKKRVFSCPVCKLQYYKLKTHYKKYHPTLICKFCSTCFGSERVFDQHSCSKTLPELQVFTDSSMTQKQYDLLLVCELCLAFTKNTANFKYEVVGEKCEIGTRQRCFYCAKEFFEVKLVKRLNFMTAIKIQNLKNNDLKEGKKKGQVSNKAKLQIIQKRLKAMKK